MTFQKKLFNHSIKLQKLLPPDYLVFKHQIFTIFFKPGSGFNHGMDLYYWEQETTRLTTLLIKSLFPL